MENISRERWIAGQVERGSLRFSCDAGLMPQTG
jgi:hypothetical protein